MSPNPNTISEIVVPNPHENSKPLTSLNLHHCVKLNSSNYTTWRFQLMHILFGFSFLGFVDGTENPPNPTVIDSD
ncbi:hypothetical protein vseg_019829 [Gypsophila vaccaria]